MRSVSTQCLSLTKKHANLSVKTKLLVAGLPQLTGQLPAISLTVLSKTRLRERFPGSPVLVAKDLGVYLDQCLNYNIEKTKSASACFLQLVQVNSASVLHIPIEQAYDVSKLYLEFL